jgi:hypothetical protein
MKTYTAQVMVTYTTYKTITVEFEADEDAEMTDLEATAEGQACNELCEQFGDLGDIEHVEILDIKEEE